MESRGNLVRESGLEPPCPFGRQPLKLVRLPISPLAHLMGGEERISAKSFKSVKKACNLLLLKAEYLQKLLAMGH